MSMQRIDSRLPRWPLHDAAASRAVEASATAAQPPHALMQAAGLAVARMGLALAPHAPRIHVWAGPGNNGGDGLVAARHLHQCGRRVAVTLLADIAALPFDARWAFDEARAAGVPISDALTDIRGPGVLSIDALLGLGASRAPAGDIANAIRAINARGGPVLAVDLPSGLHADTGTALGEAAVVASATLALLTIKPGCHTAQGRDHAGEVWFDDLGVALAPPSAWLCQDPSRARRAHASHKGHYGDVAVVGGATGMTGAAWLAARAALAAGAGRVFCSPLDESAVLTDMLRPELMGRRDWWLSDRQTLAGATVVGGCGGGLAIGEALPALLAHVRRLVLDADALNVLAESPALDAMLAGRASRGSHTILTPHPLEAARLLRCGTAAVQADRLKAAQSLADRFKVTVVLKGSGSVIAAPGELPRINASGNAALATAGTGDVLAGWTGGLWSQMPSATAIDVATWAAGQHGAAADDWLAQGHHGPLLASDLVDALMRG